jgi:hypothetical protein
MQNDSVDKVITRYFATVTREPFSYQGKVYHPKALRVSPLLLRDYTCPPGCAGCCFKFTLDFLPAEPKPDGLTKRMVEFDGRLVEIWSDPQEGNDTNQCKNVMRDSGRCGIYAVRPFSCDFELIRSLQSLEDNRANVLTQKLFGRGWSYLRVDGGKGALCEMLPISKHSTAEVVRKLGRLKQWSDHFGLMNTWVPDILRIIQEGHLTHQILLDPYPSKGFGL